MDVFNEEICTLLKKKIKGSLASMDDLSIRFSYQGEVSLQDSEEILEKITTVHNRILEAASSTKNDGRKKALILFAENLERSFYGFEPDFYQQNVSRIVDDLVSQIQASLEIWPTLIEICYLHKAGLQHLENVSGFKLATYESAKTLWHYILARSSG